MEVKDTGCFVPDVVSSEIVYRQVESMRFTILNILERKEKKKALFQGRISFFLCKEVAGRLLEIEA